jgi:hypothetical protein
MRFGRFGQIRVVMCVTDVSSEAGRVNVAFAAIHTLLRLCIVDFFVPLKFLDGMKNFPTMTKIIFDLFLHF